MLIVKIKINKPIDYVWQLWTRPSDIANWNIPFEDWHCPIVKNDLKVKGEFFYRMESKDGKEGFDHFGSYDKVVINELIEYTLFDKRKSIIEFISDGEATFVIENFEPEKGSSDTMQKDFCTSVLIRFKEYAENRM